jgi:hypothetical protein
MERAGIPYAVVGDCAVAAWVSRMDEAAVRTTRDVVILSRCDDLEQAKAALAQAGFIHRWLSSLGKAGSLDDFLDGPDAGVRDALHIILASEKVYPDSLFPSPDVSESEKADHFQLISLDALVRMKLTTFRDKDRTHLRDLLELGLIDETSLKRLPNELSSRLRELIENPEG